MKSKFTFLFLFFQIISTAQVIWQEHFETTQISVLSTQVLSGGKAFNLVGIKDGTLYSLGLNGKQKIINNNTFSRNRQLNPEVIYTLNGKNYLMISQEEDTLRYGAVNLTGRFIWEKSLHLVGKINAVCMTTNKEIVMVGQKKELKFVCKINQDGELIWEHTFGPGALLDVEMTDDGGVIVAGYVDMYFSPDSDFFISKLDATGKNEWERAYGEPDKIEKAYLITMTSNNQIMVVGQRDKSIWMLQINKEQEVDWQEEIGRKDELFIPTSICATTGGQTMFTANVQSEMADNHLFVAKLNNSFGEVPKKKNREKIDGNVSSIEVKFSIVGHFNRESIPLKFERKQQVYQETTTSSLSSSKFEIYGSQNTSYQTYVIYFDKNKKAHFSPILSSKTTNTDIEFLTKVKVHKNTPLIIVASNEVLNKRRIQEQFSQDKSWEKAIPEAFSGVNMNDEFVAFDKKTIQAWTTFKNPRTVVFVLKLK